MTTETQAEFKIEDWLRDIIDGPGGMNAYEKYELVIWNESERMAAARWAIKCLANPRCEGSVDVLKAIARRRAELGAEDSFTHRANRRPVGDPPLTLTDPAP